MDAKTLRQRGLRSVSSAWSLSIGAAAVAFLLATVGSSFLPDISTKWLPYRTEWIDSVRVNLVNTIPFLGLVRFIIGGVVEVGYCNFLLKQHDHRNPQFGDLFAGFDRFGTYFAQRFLRILYVFLWCLLLIVPGIMAAYSYALTPYILAENPDLTASEAITRSKNLMYGHRLELFVLELTFIGWSILSILTFNIGNLWLNPYRNATIAAFYRELQGGIHPQITGNVEY